MEDGFSSTADSEGRTIIYLRREENDQRVREVLVLLGQGLRAAAEKEVDGLALPMRESDIQLRCNQAVKDSLQRYVSCPNFY